MYRWVAMGKRAVLLALLGVLLGGCGCSSERRCSKHSQCKIKERCDEKSGVCTKGCGSDADCSADSICELSLRQCVAKPCPKGGQPTSSGCLCQVDSECVAGHLCVKGDGGKVCKPICAPGVSDPDTVGCVCPKGWSWSTDRCLQDCPSPMKRDEKGRCQPDWSALFATYWEKDKEGAWRQTCPARWKRSDQGDCQLPLPPAPAAPKAVGPNKPCDPKIKWDEDFVSRQKLPKETQVLYVDPSASPTDADGTKDKPYPVLEDALNNAPKGAVVLLARGDYKWGQSFPRSVHLVGVCTQEVRFRAADDDADPGITASVFESTLEGFTLLGGKLSAIGISLKNAQGEVFIRHVEIRNMGDSGIRIASNKVTVEHVSIKATRTTKKIGAGILIAKGSDQITIQKSDISENSQRGIWIDDEDTTPSTRVLVRECLLEKNGKVGIEISGKPKRVELLGNAIQGTGSAQEPGVGILIDADSVHLTAKQNRLENNPPYGVRVVQADKIELLNNSFTQGQSDQAPTLVVWIEKSNTALLEGNRIVDFQGFGVQVDNCKSIEIRGNLLQRIKKDIPSDGGISIQPMGGQETPSFIQSVKIEDNTLLSTGNIGIFVNIAEDIQVRRNRVLASVDAAFQVGGVKRGYSLDAELVVEHNYFQPGKQAGIRLFELSKAELLGNSISSDGESGVGIAAHQVARVTLRANLLLKLRAGLQLVDNQRIAVEDNVLLPAADAKALTQGIYVQGLSQSGSITRNLVAGAAQGGLLFRVGKNADLKLKHNVWVQMRHVGLSVIENLGRILVEEELFANNGGRHVEALNNTGFLQFDSCGFSNGKSAEAQDGRGWGKSAGMGVVVGSRGLVRWVFAKAKAACSQKDRAFSIDVGQGWRARPVRVPYDLDPCTSWEFSTSVRSEDARRSASKCQKCYAKKMGCRWVWRDASSDEQPGNWEPSAVECVDAGAADSCINAPSEPHITPRTLSQSVTVKGQCLKVSKDPCDENRLCGSPPSKTYYCARTHSSLGSQVTWGSTCVLLTQRGPCHSTRKACPDGTLCVRDVTWEMPLNATPAKITLKRNVFWDNPGPDILLDLIGLAQIDDNQFLSCASSAQVVSCTRKGKLGYVRKIDPDRPSLKLWKEVPLPEGVAIVWQHPSRFSQARYKSQIGGNDTKRTRNGLKVLYQPNFCNALDTH